MRKRSFMPRKISVLERFERLTEQTETCWLWRGEITNNGYGRMTYMRKRFMAHRWSYEYFNGPIKDGLQIDHLCRVRHCVNPAHLEAVTCSENLARGQTVNAVNKNKTHCIRGHEYNDDNTKIDFRGDRYCKECSRLKAAKFRLKKKLENASC